MQVNSAVKKLEPPAEFQRLMTQFRSGLQKRLPQVMSVDRLIGLSVGAMRRNPKLQDCSMGSVINSVIQSGMLGLEPNTPLGHAYLIPYKRECTFQVGYRGLMNLAMRGGQVRKFDPQVVFEGDEFEIEYGSNEHMIHRPKFQSSEWLGAYSLCKFATGEMSWLYLPKATILGIRDNHSQSYRQDLENKTRYSPWTTAEDEMAMKTVVKRHCKRLELNVDLARASELDDQGDSGKQDSILEAEFEELAYEAKVADGNLAGSREKAEEVANQKMAEFNPGGGILLPNRQADPNFYPIPPTQQEMDEATRKASEPDPGTAARERQAKSRTLFFGGAK